MDIGYKAECVFEELANVKGHKIAKSTRYQNMFEHYDYILDDQIKVDVKARKRLNRHNTQQDTWIWVEFKNVKGNPGWLYGKADIIAFETYKNFLLISRSELTKLSETLVDRSKIAKRSIDAKYIGYRRFDRPFELTGMINIHDIIENIGYKVWDKLHE